MAGPEAECMYAAAYLYPPGATPPPEPPRCRGLLRPVEVRLSRRIPGLRPFALCDHHADRLVRSGRGPGPGSRPGGSTGAPPAANL